VKRIAYSNFGRGFGRSRGNSFVDYEIFDGNTCVFSGITRDGTSTVNAVESIIGAILKKEVRILEFYDLQTQKGYDYFEPGEYEFNRLVTRGDPSEPEVVEWVEEDLPQKVREAFKDNIGPNPRARVFD